MNGGQIHITAVTDDDDTRELIDLLTEFHDWMHDHFVAYDPSEELQDDRIGLQQDRVPSWAWVARRDDHPVGCVLLFGLSPAVAEFRRLWVRPDHRGRGIGRRLVQRVIDRSVVEGYERLGLTAPPWSDGAVALYEDIGFEHTPPYPATRLPEEFHEDAIFMQLDLTEWE